MSPRSRSSLAFVLFAVPLAAQESRVSVRAWEHERSDLPVDTRFHFGRFDNGLRWVWARNSEPKERSYLRLHVDVGSLAEEDGERGMAHFLEHMAFNGSEHFAPGTLIEWFQRHGMSFGADLNAQTDFSETIYKLDLPDSDAETLGEGLLVLRDFANGLSLLPEEIEKEKGVIDGEERESDSPGYRLFVRQLAELLGETRLDDRIPIGVREVRAKFTAEAVRAFYRKWYRPELMTLVLVGDLGELDPLPLITEHFGSLAPPPGPPASEPPPGTVQDLSRELCFFEPEIPSVTLRAERLVPFVEERFDRARWREETPLQVARRMLDLRFAELVKREDAPFLSAGAGSAAAFRVVDGEDLTVRCAPGKWKEALAVGEQELRRALEHGFQEAELAEVRANALRSLDEAVERERTQTSASLVSEILNAAENPYVPTAAETDRSILRPLYESLTVEDCHRALVEAWSRGERTLLALGALDLGPEAGKLLEEAWEASRAVEVEKGAEISVQDFAYASEGAEPGAIEARVHQEELDFDQVRFENGVALDVKRTDFREQQVLFRVLLGEGRLSLSKAELPLGWMAERVFEDGGLEAHTIDELRRLLAGKEVGLSFSVGVDAFVFGGATTAEDLLLQCELVCAYLGAPGWREDGYVRVKRELPLVYEGLKHQHQGPVLTDFMAALFEGDERFTFFPQAKLEAVELGSVRAWLTPFLAEAPLEVSFVGDLEVEEVVRAAARTFGKLPARRELRRHEEHRRAPAPKSGVAQRHEIDTQVPKSLVLTVFPIPDGIDPLVRWRFEFLAEVVRDRLRTEVRERLGAAYAPTAGLQQSQTLEGVGLLLVQALTEPGAAEGLRDACFAVTDALSRDGVTQEEVDRLREPVLKNLRDARRQNGWWLGVLSESQRRPETLEEVAMQTDFFRTIGAEPLSELAKTYLVREKSSTVIVDPREQEQAGAEDSEKED